MQITYSASISAGYDSRLMEVPVGMEGTIDVTVDLDEFKNLEGERYFAREFHDVELRLQDPVTSQCTSLALPLCNPVLEQAITSSTVHFVRQFGWVADYLGWPAVEEWVHQENAVLRTRQDMENYCRRHRMAEENVARLPHIDFMTQIALVVMDGPTGVTHKLDVTAVEPLGETLVVRSVRWTERLAASRSLYWVVSIPRTSKRIEFAPIATGLLGHREEFFPSLNDIRFPVFWFNPEFPRSSSPSP